MTKKNNQIKSKERVSDFGEVNTSDTTADLMLDLADHQAKRVDSRYLEPACGDGVFLEKIILRKLSAIKNLNKNQYEYEKMLVVLTGSVYGVEILEDNVKTAKENLYKLINKEYTKYFTNSINKNILKSVQFILDKNIIHGDALTLLNVTTDDPIVFCEWSIVMNKLKRKDFTFDRLLSYEPFGKDTLFSDLGDNVYIPEPNKDYDLVSFDKAYQAC